MRRSGGRGTRGSFKGRAGKTHRMNTAQPLRGGWRL